MRREPPRKAPCRQTPLHVHLPHPRGFRLPGWDEKTGNPPPSPAVPGEERTGGGKAWPGLPATLRNSFKARDAEGSCGNARWFSFGRPRSLRRFPPAGITRTQPQPQPTTTCQRGMGTGPGSAAPPVKHSPQPSNLSAGRKSAPGNNVTDLGLLGKKKKKIRKKARNLFLYFPVLFKGKKAHSAAQETPTSSRPRREEPAGFFQGGRSNRQGWK